MSINSCKTDSRTYKNLQFTEYNMKVETPIGFKSANAKEIKESYNLGSKDAMKHGYFSDSIQNNLLFLNKGEFSTIKIKYTPLSKEEIKDYKALWENFKKMTFDIINKEKMIESTIDTTSRIENINGIAFYVFETNVNLLDLKNNKTRLRLLRYSTPLNELDLAINADYINQIDEEDILKTIRSIRITKK
ncbi:MAG: hypothetical protein ACI9FW_000988 [Flavobacterium sp.]